MFILPTVIIIVIIIIIIVVTPSLIFRSFCAYGSEIIRIPLFCILTLWARSLVPNQFREKFKWAENSYTSPLRTRCCGIYPGIPYKRPLRTWIVHPVNPRGEHGWSRQNLCKFSPGHARHTTIPSGRVVFRPFYAGAPPPPPRTNRTDVVYAFETGLMCTFWPFRRHNKYNINIGTTRARTPRTDHVTQ